MSSDTPKQPTIIRAAIEQALGELLWTGQPGRIETYDRETRLASVQPLIRVGRIDRATGERVLDTQPVIPSVPVIMLGTARAGISVAVQAGDTVWLAGSKFQLDGFLAAGGMTDPDDDRRNDPTDAVAFAGLFSSTDSPESSDDGLVVHGSRIRLGGLNALIPAARKTDTDAITVKLNSLIAALGNPVPVLVPPSCSSVVSLT